MTDVSDAQAQFAAQANGINGESNYSVVDRVVVAEFLRRFQRSSQR